MEEMDVSSRGPAMGLTSPRENPFRGSGLPPRRGHRRSNSDVPLGFSAMIHSSPQLVPISSQGMLGQMANTREKSGNDKPPIGLKKLELETVNYAKNYVEEMGERKSDGEVVDNLFESLMDLDRADTLNSCGANGRDKDTIVRGTKVGGGDINNYESESLKKNAAVAPQLRHYRSISMDSGIGNFQFGDSSPNLQTSLCNRADQLSPSNSLSENSTDINLDFGHGEFNEVELKKIRADERLTEIAVSDPKRAKRYPSVKIFLVTTAQFMYFGVWFVLVKIHFYSSGYWQTGSQLLVLRRGSCATSLNWNTRCRHCKQSPARYPLKLLFSRCIDEEFCFSCTYLIKN